jgi:hypothetical protein
MKATRFVDNLKNIIAVKDILLRFLKKKTKDDDKTTQFVLFYLNKHVEALNSIYNSLPFFDTSKENYYIGLQFMIYRTKVKLILFFKYLYYCFKF